MAVGAEHPERHIAGGDIVRDLILGMSDGLTTPFALAAGLVGASTTNLLVVIGGLAEITAGSISMGLGGYLAAQSQAETYRSELAREMHETEVMPAEERAEVWRIFRNYGLRGRALEQATSAVTAERDAWVRFMMREELGFNENLLDSPIRSAFAVGMSYLAGAAVPVWPYVFFAPGRGIVVSAISTVLVLFAVGAAKTIITSRSWWKSGFESMLTGVAAAAVTYGAGRLFATR